MTTPESIISDEEIIRVHAYANFGDMSPRDVVNKGVWKYSIGYSGGHTMQQILREHGLITKPKGYRASLTEKGKRYARSVLPDPFVMQARAEKAEAARLSADFDLVEKYRNPISGIFSFPEDVAAIILLLDKTVAENERLREALLRVETYHREKYENSKAEAAKYKSDGITDGSVEACLSDALLHLEASKYVGGLIAADRAAIDRREGG